MTNFLLKDCYNITIEEEDVQRIKILNDVVWEKVKKTKIILTSSIQSTGINTNFILKATLVDANNNVINGNITFSNETTGEQLGTKATNNGITSITVSSSKLGINTFKATFNKTGNYSSSETTINVTIEQKTPTITIIGENNIYKTWKIGCILTVDSNKPVINETVTITINGLKYDKITNSKGIAYLTINLNPGTYTATFSYDGNDTSYNAATSKTRTYNVQEYATSTLSLSSSNIGTDTPPYQKWQKNSSTSFQCLQNNLTYNNSGLAIATRNGSKKRPAPLTLTYQKNNISKIYKATLKYTANQSKAIKSATGGALFNSPPTITLSINGGINYTSGTGAQNFNRWNYYGNYYASKGPINQVINWSYQNGTSISSNPIVKIEYPANEGYEEGFLTIEYLSFIISYTPTQPTSFS